MDDFKLYFGIGWEHIMSWKALDHLLFIAALVAIYLINDWKQVLILVTAFTIGHSLTLVLSVYNIIKIQDKWVEFLIPCTIIITALSNLFQKNFTPTPIAIGTIRINYFLALFFGLIHGLGFANSIRFMLADDQNLGVGLFGFNVGLELGQIVVVTLLLLFSYAIINLLKIARRDWVIFLSAAVFSLALKIALERIP
jgi:hypothetical protein